MNDVMFWTVMGESSAKAFVNASLPTLLSDGNLPAYDNIANTEFILFALEEWRNYIQESPAWKYLSKLGESRIVSFDEDAKYFGQSISDLIGVLHQKALDYASLTGAGIFPLLPTYLFGDGSFLAINRARGAGKKVVLSTAVTADKMLASMIVDHIRVSGQSDSVPIRLPAQSLSDWAAGSLSGRWRQAFCWNSPGYVGSEPRHVAWEGEGMVVIHSCQQEVLYIRPDIYPLAKGRCGNLVDVEFVQKNIGDWGGVYVGTDSASLCVVSIDFGTASPRIAFPSGPGPDPEKIGRWMLHAATALGAELYRHEYCLHGGGRGSAHHAALTAQAAPFVERVLSARSRLMTVDSTLL